MSLRSPDPSQTPEVDFDEAVDLGDAGGAEGGSKGKAKASDAAGRRLKGRGSAGGTQTTMGDKASFETIPSARSGVGPAKSIEGWIVFVTGLHEEAQEDDVHDKFCDFGDIRNLHLNLDRRTGFVKGYALVEFASQKEAQGAIDTMHGGKIMGQEISVDWAFSSGPSRAGGSSRR